MPKPMKYCAAKDGNLMSPKTECGRSSSRVNTTTNPIAVTCKKCKKENSK